MPDSKRHHFLWAKSTRVKGFPTCSQWMKMVQGWKISHWKSFSRRFPMFSPGWQKDHLLQQPQQRRHTRYQYFIAGLVERSREGGCLMMMRLPDTRCWILIVDIWVTPVVFPIRSLRNLWSVLHQLQNGSGSYFMPAFFTYGPGFMCRHPDCSSYITFKMWEWPLMNKRGLLAYDLFLRRVHSGRVATDMLHENLLQLHR